jgi:hypothetical protein
MSPVTPAASRPPPRPRVCVCVCARATLRLEVGFACFLASLHHVSQFARLFHSSGRQATSWERAARSRKSLKAMRNCLGNAADRLCPSAHGSAVPLGLLALFSIDSFISCIVPRRSDRIILHRASTVLETGASDLRSSYARSQFASRPDPFLRHL